MIEPGFERSLGEWIQDGPSGASPWVLESVVEHARRHPNQPWWVRMPRISRPLGTSRGGLGGAPAWRRHLVGLTAFAATATAVLLAIPMVVTAPHQHPVVPPVHAPSSPTPSPSPDGVEGTPGPTVQVGFPDDGGRTGSVWLEQADGEDDHYITLHPDGTLIERIAGAHSPVGIGLWEPDGKGRLSSVVVYPNASTDTEAEAGADQVATPGFITYRAEWLLDEPARSGTLTWSSTAQTLDGPASPDATGGSTLTRLGLAPLPVDARFPVPAERRWEAAIGPMAQGPGSGLVSAVADLAVLDECVVGNHDPPGYVVLHGDGTAFVTSMGGTGAALWAPSGADTSALTVWASLGATGHPGLASWVGEIRGKLVLTGSEDGFDGRFVAAARRIWPMDGTQLPVVDASLWPEEGFVWLRMTSDGAAVTAYLADGTVIARDSRFGTGAGYWQPIDGDTIASSVFFATTPGQNRYLLSEATIGSDGRTMSMSNELLDRNSGANGRSEDFATRLQLRP